MKSPFFLVDTDTANLVGVYPTEMAALRAVAKTAHEYGPASEAAVSLALLRDNVPGGALVARGAALVKLALATWPAPGAQAAG